MPYSNNLITGTNNPKVLITLKGYAVSNKNLKEKEKALAQAIEAVNCKNFPHALSAFVKKLSLFDNLIIIVYCGEQNPIVLHREYTDPIVYQPMDTEYVTGAYLLDPFFLEHLKGTQSGFLRLLDVAPDRFKRTDYYKIYYQQTTLKDEIAIFAGIGPAMTITACFGKDRSSGISFNKRDLNAIKEYENVLTSLVKVHWKDFKPNREMDLSLPPLSERLRDAFKKETNIALSPRQAEVAMYILRGHSSLSIGLNLGISSETVKVFRRQLYAKCNISSQAELFAKMLMIFSGLSDSE